MRGNSNNKQTVLGLIDQLRQKMETFLREFTNLEDKKSSQGDAKRNQTKHFFQKTEKKQTTSSLNFEEININAVLSEEANQPKTSIKCHQVNQSQFEHENASSAVKKSIIVRSYFLSKFTLKIERLERKTKTKKNSKVYFGGNWTHLAMKSRESYMIGTKTKVLEVVEDNKVIFSEAISSFASLTDMIYIEPMNYYLMDHNTKLYRKNIDDKPPYLFMEIVTGFREGACFQYSRQHDRLIVNKDYKNISVVNLEEKKVEIEVEKEVGDFIEDFRLFGNNEDRVVAITGDAYLLLYKLDYEEKIGVICTQVQIALIKERNEWGLSVAVCQKSRYICVEIADWRKNTCSRVIVFKITKDTLVQCAVVDQYNQKIGKKYAFECLGYAGKFIQWVGLSKNRKGFAQVYEFDTSTEEAREAEEKRISHLEYMPPKFTRLGSRLYYTGHGGKIMNLRIRD